MLKSPALAQCLNRSRLVSNTLGCLTAPGTELSQLEFLRVFQAGFAALEPFAHAKIGSRSPPTPIRFETRACLETVNLPVGELRNGCVQ
jgi:hypothetical protein